MSFSATSEIGSLFNGSQAGSGNVVVMPHVPYALFSSTGTMIVRVRLLQFATFGNASVGNTSSIYSDSAAGDPIPRSLWLVAVDQVEVRFIFDESVVRRTSDTVTTVRLPILLLCTTPATAAALSITVSVGPQLLSSAAQVSKGTAAAGAALSIVTASPTAAAQLSRMIALQEISSCIFAVNDDDPISFSDGSYLGLSVGTTPGRYVRGAILGNTIVIAVGSIVLISLLLIIVLLRQQRIDSASQQRTHKFGEIVTEVCESGHIPSIYSSVYVVFAPVMIGFGMALFFFTDSSAKGGNTFLGIVTLLAGGAFPAWSSHSLRKLSLAIRLARRKQREGGTEKNRATTALERLLASLCMSEVKWVPKVEGDLVTMGALKRHVLFFNDYTVWWYGLVDQWTSFLVGVVSGIRVESRSMCTAQLAVMLLVFVVICAAGIFVNPGATRSTRWFQGVTNFCGLAMCCIMIAGVDKNEPLMLDASSWLGATVNIVALIKLVLDLVFLVARRLSRAQRQHHVEDAQLVIPETEMQVERSCDNIHHGEDAMRLRTGDSTVNTSRREALGNTAPVMALRAEKEIRLLDADLTSNSDCLITESGLVSLAVDHTTTEAEALASPADLAKRGRDNGLALFGIVENDDFVGNDHRHRLIASPETASMSSRSDSSVSL